MPQNATATNKLVRCHLRESDLHTDDSYPWELKSSPLGDRGLFATRDIAPGEVIFVDHPLILGPRAGVDIPHRCVVCHNKNNLRNCSKLCGLTICGVECEESLQHKAECSIISSWKNGHVNVKNITRYLAPIRALLLNDNQKNLLMSLKYHSGNHHGFEVDTLKELGLKIPEDDEALMRIACGVMDANAFEVVLGDEDHQTSLRGLYPLGGLVNHRCSPNATHIFDDKKRMVVKAALVISEGEEIFHSYTRLTWSTSVRGYHLLRTKHFRCFCQRCSNPSEFGSNLSAVFCQDCRGLVLPINPLKMNTMWRCSTCGRETDAKNIIFLTSVFGSRIASFQDCEVDEMFSFLDKKHLPEKNHIIVELKYKLVWILGYMEGYKWKDLSDEHLSKKEGICRELLQLLDVLQTGRCKMRALLLYEVCCCLREHHRRIGLHLHPVETNNNYKVSEAELDEIEEYLEEAADILKFDVSAPFELKKRW